MTLQHLQVVLSVFKLFLNRLADIIIGPAQHVSGLVRRRYILGLDVVLHQISPCFGIANAFGRSALIFTYIYNKYQIRLVPELAPLPGALLLPMRLVLSSADSRNLEEMH